MTTIKKIFAKVFPVFIFLIFIFFSKCDTTEPPPGNRKLTLTLEDASCTEVWIQLTTENLQLPAEINFNTTDANGNLISQVFNLISEDSIIYIDSLLPNKTYNFQAGIPSISNSVYSNKKTTTTMDTTSHNFSWQVFEFGEVGITSEIKDAAIFSQNNIYAVGEIFLNDSTGQIDPVSYGLIKWDGNVWTFSKVVTKWPSGVTENLAPTCILAFNEDNIWYVAGGAHKWDGEKITSYWLNSFLSIPDPIFEENQWLESIWGDREDNIYISGLKGALARFDGERWLKIETQMDGDLLDICGVKSIKKNNYEIYCTKSYLTDPNSSGIIKVTENDKVENIKFNLGYIIGIWGLHNSKTYGCGRSVYLDNTTGWNEVEFDNYFLKRKIKGSGLNNIFVIGGYGFVGHFNGVNWKDYPGLKLEAGNYHSVTVKKDVVVICGTNNGKGILVIGKRNS